MHKQEESAMAAPPEPASGLVSIIRLGCTEARATRSCLGALCQHTLRPWELILAQNGTDPQVDAAPERHSGQTEIADAFHVSEVSVSRWRARAHRDGPIALLAHPEHLPPYAPDLNPVEAAWQHLKHVELRNVAYLDLEDLHLELHLAIGRLRHKHHLMRSFFGEAGLEIRDLPSLCNAQ